MKKQTKSIDKTIPAAFSELVPDNKALTYTLVQRVDGEWFKFSDSTSAKCGFTDNNVVRQFVCWEEFDRDVSTPVLDTLILTLFGDKVVKQLAKLKKVTHEDKTLAVWRKLCLIATDRRDKPAALNTDPVTGKKVRKSSIGSRTYTLLTVESTNKTPQILALLRIISESVDAEQHITESDLKTKVLARAEELKTKQDPWRIFQYYRPTLIANKNIRHD